MESARSGLGDMPPYLRLHRWGVKRVSLLLPRVVNWEGVKQVAPYFTTRLVKGQNRSARSEHGRQSPALRAPTHPIPCTVLLLELRDHGVHAETVRTRY